MRQKTIEIDNEERNRNDERKQNTTDKRKQFENI